MVKKINHLDLFSGIGGFSLGLKQAGIEHNWLGFSDIDSYANKLFKRRFKDAEELGSVTNVSYNSLNGRRIDLLTGGFPCQAFSIAGKRKGFDDTRGTLFFEIQRILQDYIDNEKPIPCILLENVKGLLNHELGQTLATIYGILSNLNYTLECQLVNTKWWLPQNRERIYIFGRYNGNPSGRKIFPIYNNDKEFKNERKIEIVGHSGSGGQKGHIHSTNGIVTSLTATDYKQPKQILTHSLHPRTSKTGKGGSGPLSKQDGTAYCIDTGNAQAIEYKILDDYNNKIKEDGVCGTITQHCSRSARKNGMKVIETYDNDMVKIRKITPVEAARLQGFPDDWNDCQSDSQRYKQYGNSISVPIAESIFNKLYKEK